MLSPMPILQVDAVSLVSDVAFPVAAFLLLFRMYREERRYVRDEHDRAREERDTWVETVRSLQSSVERQTEAVEELNTQIRVRERADEISRDLDGREEER